MGGMYVLYLLAFIPVLVGGLIWHLNPERVQWFEWVGCSLLAFAVAGIMHLIAVKGMSADTETWSGQIVHVTHFPAWTSWYNHAVYVTVPVMKHRTDSKGHMTSYMGTEQRFSHYEKRYTNHPEHFEASTSLGTTITISMASYQEIMNIFGGEKLTQSNGCANFVSGDSNRYVTVNKTKAILPVTKAVSFENRVKCSPSAFSFKKVPKTVQVFPYPANANPLKSDRLLGGAVEAVNILEWDQMNARLGPTKQVNVILCGFGDQKADIAEWQMNAWLNGKKNDLVLCYGGDSDPTRAMWSAVFGWTEKIKVKEELQKLLVSGQPINSGMIPQIEKIIVEHYQIKDWTKLDYVTLKPTRGIYIGFILFQLVVQAGAWFWAKNNDF